MNDYSIQNVLEALKTRLDENNLLDVHSTSGIYPKVGFKFNNPITPQELDHFITKYQLNLPTEYKDFLLLHNGATFFTFQYGDSFCLYSIEEMIRNYNSMNDYCDVNYFLKNCYPIGYVTDEGTLLLDHSKNKTNVLLNGISTISFYCDLKTWLERMFFSQGHKYWDWFSKEVHFE